MSHFCLSVSEVSVEKVTSKRAAWAQEREREREKGGSKEAVLSNVKSKVVVVVCVSLSV